MNKLSTEQTKEETQEMANRIVKCDVCGTGKFRGELCRFCTRGPESEKIIYKGEALSHMIHLDLKSQRDTDLLANLKSARVKRAMELKKKAERDNFEVFVPPKKKCCIEGCNEDARGVGQTCSSWCTKIMNHCAFADGGMVKPSFEDTYRRFKKTYPDREPTEAQKQLLL